MSTSATCPKCGMMNFGQLAQCLGCQTPLPGMSVSALCLRCGAQLLEDSGVRFCHHCGAAIPAICGNLRCGRTIPGDSRFCPYCGTKTGATA